MEESNILGEPIHKTKRQIYKERCDEKEASCYVVEIYRKSFDPKTGEQIDKKRKIKLSEREYKQFVKANARLGYETKVVKKPKEIK